MIRQRDRGVRPSPFATYIIPASAASTQPDVNTPSLAIVEIQDIYPLETGQLRELQENKLPVFWVSATLNPL